MHLFPADLTPEIQQAKGLYCLILEECLQSPLLPPASWLPELNSSPLVGQCLQKNVCRLHSMHFQEQLAIRQPVFHSGLENENLKDR